MIKVFIAPKRAKRTQDTDLFGVSLYNFVADQIYKRTKNFRPFLCEEDIEDLIHDTYLRVYDKRDKYNPEGNFSGWVYRICERCVNSYTSGKRDFNEIFAELEEDFEDDDAPDMDYNSILGDITFLPDKAVMNEEFKEKFWRCIDRLSPESREVAELLMEETPYKKMAMMLGCTEGNVRIKVFRVRNELRKFGLIA